MAPPYKRGFSFTGFQANQPRAPQPGQRLDIEFDEIAGVLTDFGEAIATLRPLPARSLNVNLLNSAAYPQAVTIDAFKLVLGLDQLQPALGFTPENVARRGQANGYAPLDANAKVPAVNLDTSGLQPLLGFTPENAARRGQPNGYAPLGTDGKVPFANLPDLGGGGSTGPITSSSITDSTPSGRAVLTGTPAQGRTALQLGAAALLAVGTTVGTVAAGDDPRLLAVSNPVYDRQAAGGHSRTFAQIASDAVNILEWLTDAMIAGMADAGPALNACMTYCRSSGRTTAHVPSFPGIILINTPVNYQGVHIMGPGRGGVSEAHFKTTADINTFYSDGPSTGLSGIRLDHVGNGLFVALPRSLNHVVYDNMFYATNAAGEVSSATKAMIAFGGSNVFLRNNFFTNLRSNAYTIEVVRSSDDVCINTSILGNYFGGTGKGILVAANGNYDIKPPAGLSIGSPRARPEGLEISSNQSILTGGAFVEISSILNCRILNNMIDQSPTQGGIIFVPQGSQDYLGIYGVLILGNYISTAQDTSNGIGICHFTGAGNYCRGITVVGNEICFCGEGAYFGPNSGQISFAGNLFHSIAKGTCVRTDSAATARQIVFSKDNIFDQFGLKVNEANVNGQWRSTFSATTNTGDGTWAANAFQGRRRYLLIPHLLAFAPAPDTIQLQCRAGSDGAETIQAHVIAVDNSNVTVKVNVFGLAADFDVTVAMKCAINGPNS